MQNYSFFIYRCLYNLLVEVLIMFLIHCVLVMNLMEDERLWFFQLLFMQLYVAYSKLCEGTLLKGKSKMHTMCEKQQNQ